MNQYEIGTVMLVEAGDEDHAKTLLQSVMDLLAGLPFCAAVNSTGEPELFEEGLADDDDLPDELHDLLSDPSSSHGGSAPMDLDDLLDYPARPRYPGDRPGRAPSSRARKGG